MNASISPTFYSIEGKQGVWGAAAPQPPEAENRQGVWGAAATQPPEAENRQGVWGAAATPSRRRHKIINYHMFFSHLIV